jgi:hypothetical protein
MKPKAIALAAIVAAPLLASAGCQSNTPTFQRQTEKCRIYFRIQGVRGTKVDLSWSTNDWRGTQQREVTVPYKSETYECNKTTVITVNATNKSPNIRTIKCAIYLNGNEVVRRRSDKGRDVTAYCKFDELVPPATIDA